MSRIAVFLIVASCLILICLIPLSRGHKKAKVVHWQEVHEPPPPPPCDCKPKIVIEKVPYPVIEKIKIPVHHHHVVIKKKEKRKRPPPKPKKKKKPKDMKYKKMYKVSTCPHVSHDIDNLSDIHDHRKWKRRKKRRRCRWMS